MRRFDGRRLLVATHNAGKLAEMQALLEKARTTPPIHTEDPSPYKH